ncbi:hypothetical protein BDR07DRAFT_1423682 [Suillus spraguei]|nr:hypothetical protein BDR07DRAFT_1423682 [Suillus spraguei]
MERLRGRLGDEVPMEAVFPSTSAPKTAVPHTTMPERSRSVHPSHDDTVTFSIDHHTVPKRPLVSDETSLLGVRVKAAAGSKIGGADFKAARHPKREGFGEVEMVGFMGGF